MKLIVCYNFSVYYLYYLYFKYIMIIVSLFVAFLFFNSAADAATRDISQVKPRFTTSLKNINQSSPAKHKKKYNLPPLKNIKAKTSHSTADLVTPLDSPASSETSTTTTASMMTQDSSNTSKLVPAEILQTEASLSSVSPRAITTIPSDDSIGGKISQAEESKSAGSAEIIVPSDSYQERLDPKTLARRRMQINESLRAWYQELAEQRARAARIEKLLKIIRTPKYEDELSDCEADIESAQKGIERCKTQLAQLIPIDQDIDDEEVPSRLTTRRNAVFGHNE